MTDPEAVRAIAVILRNHVVLQKCMFISFNATLAKSNPFGKTWLHVLYCILLFTWSGLVGVDTHSLSIMFCSLHINGLTLQERGLGLQTA